MTGSVDPGEPDERTAVSRRGRTPSSQEWSGVADVEGTALSARRAPEERTAPSRRDAPGERTVRSADPSGARPGPVIRPAPVGDASRTAHPPDLGETYAPRADTAARVPRTPPAAQTPQPVVDAAGGASRRRRRARARALVVVVAGAVVAAALVLGLIVVLAFPA